MNTETIIINSKTFEVIKSAVNKMVDTIRPTFGPVGNKVIIDKLPYRMVVDDGVQIARDFELEDPSENAIVKIIREAAIRTNDRSGDGTTSSLIILQAIINEVAKKRKFNGRDIEIELKKGLSEAKQQLIKSAKEIKTKEDLKKVAMIAFDNEEIAEILSDTYFKIGKDGIITIEKSNTMDTEIEISEGIKLNNGYISPYMVNAEKLEAIIENPYILLTDYRITENTDIFPIMEKMSKENKKGLVIICDNIEHQALATLIINLPQIINPETKKIGAFPSIAINIPSVENKNVLLEDLAILTGAKVFSQSKGDKLENIEISDLGRSEKFISKKDESIIIKPKGSRKDILSAINGLKSAIESEKKESTKKKLIERLAMFTNKLAVIKVGAPTENEQKGLKYKVEDAVNAVKSAYQNGVVCGGGRALAQIKTSSLILNESLKYPSRQLMENMDLPENLGLDDDHVMNVITGKVGPFFGVGVIDPVDVLISGIESAVSIASVLLTSSGIIVEKPRKNPNEN